VGQHSVGQDRVGLSIDYTNTISYIISIDFYMVSIRFYSIRVY